MITYREIICLKLLQNWVSTPDLTILFSEQFQKKIIIFTGENWWTQFLIDMHNWPEHGALFMKC